MTPKYFFFGVVGTIAVTIGVSGYGYVYALSRLETAKTTLATSLGEQDADQAQIDALDQLTNHYKKDIVPELPLMDLALPRTKNQSELLAQIKALAGNRGLSLGSATFPAPGGLPTNTSQTTSQGSALALPVQFDVQGTFAQLQGFLTDLEKLSRFTNVTSLTVSRPDRTKPIDYSITLNAYVKP